MGRGEKRYNPYHGDRPSYDGSDRRPWQGNQRRGGHHQPDQPHPRQDQGWRHDNGDYAPGRQHYDLSGRGEDGRYGQYNGDRYSRREDSHYSDRSDERVLGHGRSQHRGTSVPSSNVHEGAQSTRDRHSNSGPNDRVDQVSSNESARENLNSFANVKPPAKELTPYEKKLEAVLPDDSTFRALPSEAKRAPLDSVMQKRRECAERVVAMIEKDDRLDQSKTNASYCDSDETSDSGISDDFPGADADAGGNVWKNQLKKFIRALPDNFFTIGFEVAEARLIGTKWCWCPCSKNKMGKWRTAYNVDSPLCDSKAYGPNALIAHLKIKLCDGREDELSRFYHNYTFEYLQLVYQDYIVPGLFHKAFYQPGEPNHTKILRREAQIRESMQDKMEAQLMKERADREKADSDNARLKSIDCDRTSELEDYQKIKERMGVVGEEVPSPSKLEMEYFSKVYERFMKCFRETILSRPPKTIRRTALFDRVPQEFDLSDLFLKWYNDLPKHELFGEMNDVNFYRLVATSTVDYEMPETIKGVQGFKHDEAVKPADEGGPLREFLSECWKQIPFLEVKFCGKRVRLFKEEQTGCTPRTDSDLGETDGGILDLMDCIDSYYAAVGRLLAHSILLGISIPTNVLGPLYRSVCVRGTDVTDPSYRVVELVYHLIQDGQGKDYLKGLANGSNADSLAEHANAFIQLRGRAIQKLRDGITLEGRICFQQVIAFMPLEAVDQLLFASPYFTAEEVVKLLYAENGEPVGHQSQLIEHLKKILVEEADSNVEFLPAFLQFCTGQNFISLDEKKKRKIEISFDVFKSGSTNPDKLPETHTCVPSVTFPETAYNGNKETLRKKLKQAMESCCGAARYNMS